MKGCIEYVDNPDRRNIKLSVHNVNSSAPMEDTFSWLLDLVTGTEVPRMLIFCKTITDCSKLYFFCKLHLPRDKMKLIDMYHSQTPDKTKGRIHDDMSIPDGCIRVLICSNAACMGVNFVGVDLVVNFGPPQEMDTLIQQIGRCGRSGEQAFHLLLFNNRQLRNLQPEVLKYVRNEDKTCLRQHMLSPYSAICDSKRIRHKCCDICANKCECHEHDVCQNFMSVISRAMSDNENSSDEEENTQICPISEDNKSGLKVLLNEYRYQLNEDSKAMFTTAPELTHGFTTDVVSTIIDNCHSLKSADDVLAKCGVWSYEQAKSVYDILTSLLDHEAVMGEAWEDEASAYNDVDDGI